MEDITPEPPLGYMGTWLEIEDESMFKGATKISTLIKEIVYPVGSIYISVNDVNPSTLFGGTWVQLTDTFLYATSTTANNGTTAPTGQGEATHTLTVDEMPSHTHIQDSHTHGMAHTHSHDHVAVGYRNSRASSGSAITTIVGRDNANRSGTYSTDTDATASSKSTTDGKVATNQNTGGGQAHNNMPPYMRVFMWKRTG